MQIIQRWAEDDFIALKTAQAATTIGADVFSISYRGQTNVVYHRLLQTYLNALESHAQYIVWIKLPDNIRVDKLDEAIEKELEAK